MRTVDSSQHVVRFNGHSEPSSSPTNSAQIPCREPSVEFWKENEKQLVDPSGSDPPRRGALPQDPPSQLIGQFLHEQKASGDYSLDVNLLSPLSESPSPSHSTSFSNHNLSPKSSFSNDVRLSFLPPVYEEETLGRPYSTSPPPGNINSANDRSSTGEVVKPMPETEAQRRAFAPSPSPANWKPGDDAVKYSANTEIPRTRSSSSPSSDSNTSSDSPPATSIPENEMRRRRHDHAASRSPEIKRTGDVRFSGEEAVKRPLEKELQRQSSSLRSKTRSRLLDRPEKLDNRSGPVHRSAQERSGLLGFNISEDEGDPFMEEDLPDEYKKVKFNIITLLEWLSLILIIAGLACTLTIPFLKKKDLWRLDLWKWEVLVLVLICGRLVSDWFIKIVVFFIERNFMLRKRVLYFVYGVRKAVQNCLWLGLVLIAWNALFNKRVERETNSNILRCVTKVLVCLLVGTLLWLVKTLVIKVLASSYHVSTYFDRIQESLFNQYVIEILSGPPVVEIRKVEEEERSIEEELQTLQKAGARVPADLGAAVLPDKSEKAIKSGGLQRSPRLISGKLSRAVSKKGDGGITIDHLHKLNPRNVSAWNMKRLINIVRYGALSTLDERVISTHEDESATLIRSEYEAKAAARKIFSNVAKPGSKYIYLDDLMRFMYEEEALKTMSLFEGAAESKKISKRCLKNWLINAFRERRALSLTLDDTKTAVNKLHKVVNAVVAVVILIIWLLILGIATSKFLVFLSSQLLLVAFIFGNTCKTVFEAIVFLFVMHPFDVGDRCEIDGVHMVVEEMNILSTVFLRYDNQKIIYPNSTLATKCVGNYYRSPDMADGIEFCIHVCTPAEKIAAMKQRINSYIENKKEHWYASPMIVMTDFEELKMVKFLLWLCHKMNHHDMGERYQRRSLIIEEMVKIFKELDIQYRLYPIDINVRAMPLPTSSRVPPAWSAGS